MLLGWVQEDADGFDHFIIRAVDCQKYWWNLKQAHPMLYTADVDGKLPTPASHYWWVMSFKKMKFFVLLKGQLCK